MIRPISFDELLSTPSSNGDLTLKDMFDARKRARAKPNEWVFFALNNKGARIELRFNGRAFTHRLNGYAADGSDAKAPAKEEPQ